MTRLETERLELVPLDARQLVLWLEDLPQLEAEMSCRYRATPLEGMFREIVQGQLAATENDRKNYFWHSFWWLIRKSDRTVVGSADFKDAPDSAGKTEIGCGLGSGFERRGYMTETVTELCAWALRQPGVSSVIAETDADGTASQNILKRCGFRLFSSGQTLWRKLEP